MCNLKCNLKAGKMAAHEPDPLLVFLVDDEDLIRTTLREVLEDGGYGVEIASTAKEAMAKLEGNGVSFAALVTDINLDGKITGWDIAKRAREIRAEIAVIYMSGRAGDEWVANGVPHSVLLNKPFAPAQLITAVSTLLTTGLG